MFRLHKLAFVNSSTKSLDVRFMIARRLRAARIAFDEVALRVAEELGVSASTWNKYETGKRFPSETVMIRFCELTGCPADWIYLGRITAEMPAQMAAQIGMAEPDLIREGPKAGVRKSGRKRGGEG